MAIFLELSAELVHQNVQKAAQPERLIFRFDRFHLYAVRLYDVRIGTPDFRTLCTLPLFGGTFELFNGKGSEQNQ